MISLQMPNWTPPPAQICFFFSVRILTKDITTHLVLDGNQESSSLSFILYILGWSHLLKYCSSVNFFLSSPPSILGQGAVFPGFWNRLQSRVFSIPLATLCSSRCSVLARDYKCRSDHRCSLFASHRTWVKDQNVYSGLQDPAWSVPPF